MFGLCAALLALSACHPIHPSTYVVDHPVVIGGAVEVSARWTATCNRTGFYSDSDPKYEECGVRPVRLEVTCDGPCLPHAASHEDPSRAAAELIATAEGQLALELVSTRADTGKVHRRRATVEVVPPERLTLDCIKLSDRYPREAYTTCGPRGVPAMRPLMYPHIYAAGQEQWSTLLRINHTAHYPARNTPPLSLVDLYPEARDGDGVRPGFYTVELELAGLVERFQIEAVVGAGVAER